LGVARYLEKTPMREFEVLPVQRGERIIGPAPDEIRA
jgi:hypothetical protein